MPDYAREEHHDFAGAVTQALGNATLQSALERLGSTLLTNNRRAYAELDQSDRMRSRAKAIKEHTLANLDRYLDQLDQSITKLGGHVHWAADADEARQIVLKIARENQCKKAVKSKSMTSEEIHLNPVLERSGIEVTETDFGEFIIQVAGERPSHLVAPAVHHTRESVAKVLSDHLGEKLPDDAESLAKTGRRVLRDKFFHADLGITGANFAVAETGTIVLVTNEGNGRLTTTWPRVHIAIMGMEKVIPRWCDLPVFLQLLARAATGQPLSVYTTLLTGPRRPGEVDGPEQFHLVILDNGRSRVLGSPFRESLQCIRCGACLNACPVYRRIGGHAYGGVYSGPIGSILTPLYDSMTKNQDLPHASSLCGACLTACPIKINIPHMLIGLRELQHRRRPHFLEKVIYSSWSMLLQQPWLYRMSLRMAKWARLPARGKDWIERLPAPLSGWTQARSFPLPAAKSFRDRWKELNP